jgi:hypothetical protein
LGREINAIYSKMVLTMMVNMNVLTLMKEQRINDVRLTTHQGVHACKPGGSKSTVAHFWLHNDR